MTAFIAIDDRDEVVRRGRKIATKDRKTPSTMLLMGQRSPVSGAGGVFVIDVKMQSKKSGLYTKS
jgi:hypothetical protein